MLNRHLDGILLGASIVHTDFDSIIEEAAARVTEADVYAARDALAIVDDPEWNMNRRLNMIAYEDQN